MVALVAFRQMKELDMEKNQWTQKVKVEGQKEGKLSQSAKIDIKKLSEKALLVETELLM